MGVKVIIKLYHYYASFYGAECVFCIPPHFLEEEFIYRHIFKVERNDNIHTEHLGLPWKTYIMYLSQLPMIKQNNFSGREQIYHSLHLLILSMYSHT